MSTRNRSKFLNHRCFFVTTTCYQHLHLLQFAPCCHIVTNSINYTGRKYHIDVLAYVLMPNHMHIILYFRRENRLSDFMRDFKKYTSVRIRNEIDHSTPRLLGALEYRNREQVFKVWNDRFHDVCIRTRRDVRIKLNYIHNNPLQEHWRLVSRPNEYPYSSAGFYSTFKQGLIPVRHYRCYF
jgi:putative transposase